MLTIGLEPITLETEQILSLSCLPFSPSEQTREAKQKNHEKEKGCDLHKTYS